MKAKIVFFGSDKYGSLVLEVLKKTPGLEIIKASEKKLSQFLPKNKQFFEGCLSLPEIYGFVDRPYQIKLAWENENGQKKTRVFTNKIGICLQHELDHLNGVLFTDWILKQKGKIYELKKDDKGQEVFEEME